MNDLIQRLLARFQTEAGQTLVEYSLILAFIALVVVAILGTLGTQVISAFTSANAGF